MRILYLAQLFELENEYDSDRHYFNCRKMVEAGHKVIVITSNVHYKTSLPKYKKKWFTSIRKNHRGIEIYYVYSPSNFLGNYFKRILYYLSYFVFSLLLMNKFHKTDVVYAVSPSLSVGLLGYLMSRRLKAHYYLEIADLWPDVFISMGYLKNKAIIKFLRKIEMFCYQKARFIIALTQGITENIQRKIPDEKKVIFIPNGIDRTLFSLNSNWRQEVDRLKERFSLDGKFVCLYLGAHNLYNALDSIIQTADLLKKNMDIFFVLIGSGDKKAELQRQAKSHGLNNILFLPPIPRSQVPVWLQIADVFLLPNLKGDFYKMNLQNKLFDYLASAKPIIFGGSGETSDIIEESNSGKVVPAEDAKALVNSIFELRSLPIEERDKMGEQGRSYIYSHYDRNILSKRLIDLMEKDITSFESP